MHAILATGVSPQWLETAESKGYTIESRNESDNIKKSAAKMMAELKLFQDTVFEGHQCDPDSPEDWEAIVQKVKSRKWDAICFGGGVRTIPQLGDYFTRLVNLAVREQPEAKLLFPLLPENVVPAVKKYLPEAN